MIGVRGVAVLFTLVIAGCAAPVTQRVEIDDAVLKREQALQRELAVRDYNRGFQRLHNVAFPILRASAAACKNKVKKGWGFIIDGPGTIAARYPEQEWRVAAKSALGITDRMKIVIVMKDGPAERAGIQVGDIPVAVGDWKVPTKKGAVIAFVKAVGKEAKKGPVRLTMDREGEKLEFSVSPDKICNYGIRLEKSGKMNAFADGKNIIVSETMMDFLRDDDSLAVVLGHEAAHNYMGHIEKKSQNRAVAGIAGLAFDIFFAALGVNTQGKISQNAMAIGGLAYSQDFEAEADYAGLYTTARAGFDIGVAPDLWRRMGSKNVKSITFASTHPTTAYRTAALAKIVLEIRRKQKAGLPLEPELKKEEPVANTGAPEMEEYD